MFVNMLQMYLYITEISNVLNGRNKWPKIKTLLFLQLWLSHFSHDDSPVLPGFDLGGSGLDLVELLELMDTMIYAT